MRNYIPVFILSALCVPLITTAKPLPEEAITTTEQPWVLEEEFLSTPTLHATRDQTVVLNLEGRRDSTDVGHANKGRRAIRRNTFRFLVEEAGDFSFCIPEDEPHIVRLKLKGPRAHGKGRGGTILITRNDACEQVTLVPGSHTVEVDHDSRGIPAGGRTAFFHQPQKTRLLGGALTGFGTPDFIAFRASNGKLVGGTSAGNGGVAQAVATNVSPGEVWDLLTYNSTDVAAATTYGFAPSNGQGLMISMVHLGGNCSFPPTIYTFPPEPSCLFLPSAFHINDQGGGAFNLILETLIAGIYTDGSDVLFYDINKPLTGETMTLEYKGFDCATTCDDTTLPLETGEVALYAQCDFQGPAMVFNINVADMSIYDSAAAEGVAIGLDMVSSIRVGPDTLAVLYDETQFGGNFEGIGADVPCMDKTALGKNTTASFQIKSTSEFITTTNGCQSCVLTGIDTLSGEDFTGANFSQSILDGADLTDTIFSSATLENTQFSSAVLSGTDFSSADLLCTQFNNAKLTDATFNNNTVAEDFSCYLNLSGATLDYTTFPVEDWRYFNFTGSTVENLPDVLSTVSEPLDLSGAILSNVGWLAGKTVDSINLGCYASEPGQTTICPSPSGNAVCTTLQGTVLTQASLKNACLQNASMEGVFLISSNLDGADLSGAQLQAVLGGKVATLEGAFMRNVNLSGANLTGVNASNVDFYSTSSGTADATDLTAPGANFSGAYLAGADFSGSNAILQSTVWSSAMLLGADFTQADLTTNTSGGVNSGTNTTFNGAYLQGAVFADAMLDDVDFTSTYWDALGSGGSLSFLIPKQNLVFSGYWKDISLPECPPALSYESGNPPPMDATDANNTCPDGLPGPCDTAWDQPLQDISLAFFKSAVPPLFPQDASVTADLQCSGSFSDPNPEDFCWITTNNPTLCSEN